MSFAKIEEALSEPRQKAIDHPVYVRLTDFDSLRKFMEFHVFAVWDFMSLVKTLQRQLTCVSVPWTPPPFPGAARLINEIVLTEESDEVGPHQWQSHFELYLGAMQDVGADTSRVEAFLGLLKNGTSAREALGLVGAPAGVRQFVTATLEMCALPPHLVASAFLFGREDLIPEMFTTLLRRMNLYHEPAFARLRAYLERHIEVDSEVHAPMARQMLHELCGSDSQNWSDAEFVARRAVEARIRLWDDLERHFQDKSGPDSTKAEVPGIKSGEVQTDI